MKAISELSKTELINLIYNTWKDTDVDEFSAECATCGTNPNAKYCYICDICDSALTDHECHTCAIEAVQCNIASQGEPIFPCSHWRAPK